MSNEQQFIYDLLSDLRKSPARLEAVKTAMRRVDIVTQEVAAGKASRQQITEAEAALVPLCGFNFGLLMPRVFPRYPVDEPLDFASRPFMFAMTALAPNSVVTLKAGRQVGKCVTEDTRVITTDGELTMLDLFNDGVAISDTLE
jgi:hypothetical protein